MGYLPADIKCTHPQNMFSVGLEKYSCFHSGQKREWTVRPPSRKWEVKLVKGEEIKCDSFVTTDRPGPTVGQDNHKDQQSD